MKKKRKTTSKAARHENKGDEYLAKGRAKKALEQYRRALKHGPESPKIYDKLIKAHDQTPGEWKMEDFAESVSWTMKKQEQEHPPIRQVHAKLSPEWNEATKIALDVLYAKDDEETKILIEKLVGLGEIATRATIGLLIDLKKAGEKGPCSGEQSQAG